MTDIKSLNYDELVTYMAGLGEKKFRASQLYQWMHEKLADSFDECTNLSNALRQKLKETSEYVCLEPVRYSIQSLTEQKNICSDYRMVIMLKVYS